MPATFPTIEPFKKSVKESSIKEEQRLRLKAGAISSTYTRSEAEGWVLTTTWNVIGEQ